MTRRRWPGRCCYTATSSARYSLGLEQGGASAGRPAERNKLKRGASLSKPIKVAGFIPRSRLEALTDGVFAFAMTLLVVNIEPAFGSGARRRPENRKCRASPML